MSVSDLLTILSAPTAVLCEPSGQIRLEGAQGVHHADRRYLAEAVLEVGGAKPTPLAHALVGSAEAMFTYTVPTVPFCTLTRERGTVAGRVWERIRVENASPRTLVTDVAVRVSTDQRSMNDVRAGRAASPVPLVFWRGPAALSWDAGSGSATPTAVDGSVVQAVLRWPITVPSQGTSEVAWELFVGDPAAVVVAPPHARRWAPVRLTDFRLTRLVAQSLADAEGLRMATTSTRDDAFLAAGSPWYFTLFGRDSLWSARLLLRFGWELAAGTLRTLAAFQGQRHDDTTREDPGKVPSYRPPAAGQVLHELRAEGSTPPTCYDSHDSTPLWVCLLHDAW